MSGLFDVVIHAFALMYQARSVPCVMHTDSLRGVFESIITLIFVFQICVLAFPCLKL